MKQLLRSIGLGFAGLLRFGGRDRRARFWPYAIFIFALGQVAGMMAMMPMFIRIQVRALQSVREPGGAGPEAVQEQMRELLPYLSAAMQTGMLIGAITVALLAAAVARRLHDSGRSAYWGLLPLPFLAASTLLMPRVFVDLPGGGTPDMSAFAWLFANNIAYLAALGWLIYLLVQESEAGPNRFGPPAG